MDAAARDRIFDPFFTTKGPGEGPGLGLAVVHGIIREHGGVITVSKKPGQAATFVIYLPVLQPSAAVQRSGALATAAGSSEAAWATFQSDPDGLAAVITDLTMPGMTGIELASKITARRPNLPVILASVTSIRALRH